MPRLDRQHFRRAALAAAAFLATTLSCGREVTGPPGGMQLVRGFTFEARFGPEGLPNGVASDLVPYTRVRVVLVNSSGATVVDRVVDFPSTVQEVPVAIDVPLASGTGSAGESMVLSLAFVNAAGDTVFRGGPQQVQVVPSVPGSEPPPVPQIPVTFTGTGAAATSVVMSRSADTVLAGNAFSYSAAALDAQGSPIAGTPIAWRSATSTRATITAPGAGAGTTLSSRGPVMIIAQLLSASAAADTLLLEVLPRAGALVGVSGSGQSALAGALLSQPVVVRVNATDGLPMAGVSVNFAAANGGSVGTASVVTNASGLAQTSWTLGGGVGAQTLAATSTGVSGSPLTISATATAPVVALIHHYQFNTDLNDIVGTANGTFGGTNNALTDQVLAFGGVDGFVQFGSQIVPNTGSYSVSLFVRSRSSAGFVEYISQGTSNAPGFYIGQSGTQLRVSDQWPLTGEPAPALDGLFHQVVLVVDSLANQSRLYVDGMLRQTLSQRIATPATGTNTRLGRQFGTFGEFLDGDIDELRIYSGAIDGAQVAALYATGSSAPGRLVFAGQPTAVTAGVAIAPPITVRVEDAEGRLRTGFTGNVAIAIGTNPGGATLGGTVTVAAVGGIATFTNLSLSAVASGYTLLATSPGLTGGGSASFNVLAAAATQLVITQQPTTAVAGVFFTPSIVVQARDPGGNVATSFTGVVTLEIASGAGTIGGTLGVSAVAGVATFDIAFARQVNAALLLRVVSAGLTPDTTTAIAVGASYAYQVVIGTQPSAGTAGQAISPPVTAIVQDPFGNTVTTFVDPVTITLQTNPTGAALGGTITVPAVAGIATFANLTVSLPGVGYQIIGGAPGLSSTLSAFLNITVAPATQLTFSVQPAGALAGQAIAPAVVVTARDGLGNVATGYTGTVTIAMGTNPGGATLSGTLTVAAVAGVATFSDLSLNNAGAGYTLVASAPGLTGATSTAFGISASVFANSWTNVAGGAWSTADNWSLGRAPIAADTVVIALAGTYAVTMDVNYTGSVMLVGGGTGTQTLAVGVRTLTVSDVLNVQPTGALTLSGVGTIAGAGTVSNQGTITTISGTVSATLVNSGTFIAQETTNINGPLSTVPGSMLLVRASASGPGTLTVPTGFTNTATIDLSSVGVGYASQLTVTTGTLVNASTGALLASVGVGGTRTLAAPVTSSGSLTVASGASLTVTGLLQLLDGSVTTVGGTLTKSGGCTQSGSITLTGTTCP